MVPDADRGMVAVLLGGALVALDTRDDSVALAAAGARGFVKGGGPTPSLDTEFVRVRISRRGLAVPIAGSLRG
ncbi:hypothetical protein FIBSPDRAFT_868204, partial [Athelia psychrophila]